jgi:hypothetical protein
MATMTMIPSADARRSARDGRSYRTVGARARGGWPFSLTALCIGVVTGAFLCWSILTFSIPNLVAWTAMCMLHGLGCLVLAWIWYHIRIERERREVALATVRAARSRAPRAGAPGGPRPESGRRSRPTYDMRGR